MRTYRWGRATAVGLAVAVSAGCGGQAPDRLVTAGKAPAAPYSGPLWVPYDESGGDGPAALKAGSGAAGRALECTGTLSSGGSSGSWSRGDGGATPEAGLAAWFGIDQPDVPDHGYRVERRDPGRVLFSFDVAGRTKVAVIVALDQPGRPGWGPETHASCDPAELPASFTDHEPYTVWTDARGHRVPVSEVSSSAGSAHCGWQKAEFLDLDAAAATGASPDRDRGPEPDRRLFARDPRGVLPPGMLASPYAGHAVLPADAHDTGYRHGGRQLWLAADRTTAYVRTPGAVESWPLVRPGEGCA